MSEIKELVNELKSEGVTKEDFDSLGEINNLTPEDLKEKIAFFDEKEGLSSAEKKLYNILVQINGIQMLAEISNSFKDGFITRMKNKAERMKDRTVTKLKETTKKVKDNIKKSEKKIKKLGQEIVEKAKKVKNLFETSIKNNEVITDKKEKAKKIQQEIVELKEDKNKKPNIEKIIKQKENELKKIVGEVTKVTETEKKIKEELEKNKKEISEIKTESSNVKKEIKDDKNRLNNTLTEVAIGLRDDKSGSLKKKIKTALIEAGNVQESALEIEEKQDKIDHTVQSTENIIDVTKNVQDTNKEEALKIEKNMNHFMEEMNRNKNDLSAINKYYNNRNKEFYKENPEHIVNITDKEKLLEVLSNPQCNPGNNDFIDFINEKFQNDLEILKLFLKKSTKLLDTKNIKNFETDDIKGNELEFFKLLKPITLKNFLISHYYGGKIQEFANKAKENDFLYEKSFGEKNTTRLFSEYLNIIGNTENNNKVQINDFNLKGFEIEKYFLEKGNIDKLDNTLLSLIDNEPDKVLQLFKGKNIDKLYYLPKLLYKIKNQKDESFEDNTIISLINIEPLFYDKFLSIKLQKKYSVQYINSLLLNSSNHKNNENLHDQIAKVQFKDISQAIFVFKALKNKDYNLTLEELLEHPKMRNSILKLMTENDAKDLMKKISNKDDILILEEMQKTIGTYYKKYENLEKIFDNSELNKTIEENKEKKSLLNNIYNNKEFLKRIEKNGANAGFIVGILRGKLGDLGETENIEEYYKLLYDNLKGDSKDKEKTFNKIITDLNKVVSNELTKKKGEIEILHIDKTILDKIKNIGLLNNGKINLDGTENEFNKYLLKLEIELKKDGKKLNKNNLDLYLNDFIKINNLSKLPENLIKEIKEYIKIKNTFNFSKDLEDDKSFIRAIREGTIKELIEKKEKTYFGNLEKKIKEYELNQELNQELKDINNRSIIDKSYNLNLDNLNINTKEATIERNGKTEKISFSNNEYSEIGFERNPKTGETTIKNPDALKSLIDMKDKLEELDIPFAFEQRHNLIRVMKTISPFNQIDSDYGDSNLLTKEGFNNYLKFLIAITGGKYSTSKIEDNYAIIRKINNESTFGEEVNTQSKFKPFGQKLVKLGVFNEFGVFNFQNEYNLRQIFNKEKSEK